jgi:hypothetical protein
VLGPLDETLAHQAAMTFDHAVTSDHRFFDRWADVTTGDARVWSFDDTPLRPPWAFIGSGCSGGWNDGLEYDISAPADVGLPDGTVGQPWHRETDVALTVIARPPAPPSTLAWNADRWTPGRSRPISANGSPR